MNCQTFSTGFRSGPLAGSGISVIFGGTASRSDRCHPARSSSSTARAPGAAVVAISAGCRFIVVTLQRGRTRPAPLPSPGQIVPKISVQAVRWSFGAADPCRVATRASVVNRRKGQQSSRLVRLAPPPRLAAKLRRDEVGAQRKRRGHGGHPAVRHGESYPPPRREALSSSQCPSGLALGYQNAWSCTASLKISVDPDTVSWRWHARVMRAFPRSSATFVRENGGSAKFEM